MILAKNLYTEETKAILRDKAEFGLSSNNSVVLLLYRCGDAVLRDNSAFSWWKVSEEDNRIPFGADQN